MFELQPLDPNPHFSCFHCFDKPPAINVWTLNIRLHLPLFYVSIVFISLTPAIPTVFILTFLSTRSIVHAIPLIVTGRSAVVIGLKICEYKSIIPTLPRLPCHFDIYLGYSMKPMLLMHQISLGIKKKSCSNPGEVQITCPVYKKGSKNDVANFMPICLTSVVGK